MQIAMEEEKIKPWWSIFEFKAKVLKQDLKTILSRYKLSYEPILMLHSHVTS